MRPFVPHLDLREELLPLQDELLVAVLEAVEVALFFK
jgi:hypothetical protein